MIYYAFNNNKHLKSKLVTYWMEKPNVLYIIHYCPHCNTELIGEWKLLDRVKLKNKKELKEVFVFAQLKECPICGETFDKIKEHHFINVCKKQKNMETVFSSSTTGEKITGVNFFPNKEVINPDYYSDIPRSEFKLNNKIRTDYGEGIIKDCFDDGAFLLVHYEQNIESILCFLRSFRSEVKETVAENKMTEFVNKCMVESKLPSINNIKTEKNFNIKGYLEQLVLIEKNIFSLSKRLKELYSFNYECEKDAKASECISLLKDKRLVTEAYDNYKALKSRNVEKGIKLLDFAIAYPEFPKKPRAPIAPTLEKPGFFNKKKILAQNALLTEKYEKELENYNVALEKYNCDLENYKNKKALLEKQREDEYNSAIKKAKETLETEIAETKAQYEDLQKKYETKALSAKDLPTPEKARHQFLKEEIETAEELLEKFYKTRNKMYSYGVVFEKYRDIVAISTFYEYISCGRCETLEGPNGAYNLYENEIRMNMVIGQLNQVIESLEEIKQNQYMVYSAIQETNSQLSKLNSSMNSVVGTLSSIKADTADMKSYMSEIANNTAVIAYNTEKTAFYAKKNAELTNALGFMLALK